MADVIELPRLAAEDARLTDIALMPIMRMPGLMKMSKEAAIEFLENLVDSLEDEIEARREELNFDRFWADDDNGDGPDED